jgi:hypothetical protein
MSSSAGHNPSREGPPGNAYVDTVVGESLPAREILATFSDEPDWGMDQDLFTVDGYNYGRAPLGFATGMSSQAPFHMAFLHEGPIMRPIVSRLVTSFVEERVRLFLALAQLASDKRIDYWAWRFAAWAMHYLQDLTQPYHARALPAPLLPAVLRSLLRPGFHRVAMLNKDYLRNRHLVFEAAVHFVLNDAVKNRVNHPFLLALAGKGETFVANIPTVLRQSSRIPAALARLIDRAAISLTDDPRLKDTRYALAADSQYRIDLTLSRTAEEKIDLMREFVTLVGSCLEQTGKVTRYAADFCRLPE